MSEQLLEKILDELTGIKEEITGIKEEITGIKEDVTGIKGEITGIKGELQTMKSQIDENTQLLNAVIHRQEETDSKLDAVSMEVHQIYGVLTEHDEKLDFLITSQSKQESTLATLALRSIEQETELRDLKRVK